MKDLVAFVSFALFLNTYAAKCAEGKKIKECIYVSHCYLDEKLQNRKLFYVAFKIVTS